MKTVYLETTVVSYYVARPSRDIVVLARQELTRQWWQKDRATRKVVVSPVVLDEARAGDPALSKMRATLLAPFELLPPCDAVERLAGDVRKALNIPKTKIADAFHVAYAVHYDVNYLLTWNLAHFANAETEIRLADFCRRRHLCLPLICTPEHLLQREDS